MIELINVLEDLETQLRNMQEHLRGQEWPSKALASLATDVSVYGGMTARATQTLRVALVALEERKPEGKEVKEEEEGGEDRGEQVRGEEVHEEPPPEAPQEPEPRGPEGT